ncbi:hypothetical protein TNCV_1048411 [Trichonephila clavipes]|nr:hypothetical protein TNCV_1048411 [Trichonephila clavipes]
MVLKATANDRRHLVLCHDEFCGPRSGLFRSGGISNNKDYTILTFMFSPGFVPRPYGTAVSVTNHYTRWAACLMPNYHIEFFNIKIAVISINRDSDGNKQITEVIINIVPMEMKAKEAA